jgi:hypothetical protein
MSLLFHKQSLREERFSQTTYKSMEVHMLRNIFGAAMLVVMLLVLVAGNAQAQTLVNANVGATATVMTALTLTPTAMAFGNVPASRTIVLDPQGVAHNYVGSVHTVGALDISGATTGEVLITWPATIHLSQALKTDLVLTLAVTGDASAANQATSGTLSSTADVTLAAGHYYLWIGGSMPTNAETGLFTGTANFTVEYK